MSQTRKPIAICGVALRLPGNVNSAEKLWEALRDGRDMRGPVPKSRYNHEGFGDALGEKGAIKSQHGYFLEEDPGCFDTSMLSLTEEEAQRTDPQQRLLLEIAYECFENSGLTKYRGSTTGTYIGTFGEDWLYSQAKEDQHSGGYILGGQADLMLANRVSYEYDLHGPSMVIKTGCSATLVALHEACRALQLGDCSGALVAGSNLILGPTLTAAMASEGILSPEGSCKSFSAEADGFARGEAVVAVYITTLDRAVQENLPIRAVIANTGVNSNGKSASILQPNMNAQAELIRRVYADIDLNPHRTAYVECHGTGTPTGDPIEVTAVGEVFGTQGVMIGSLKPNFGHSEGCSGLSSLIKSIVMLEKSMIVPNIKFETPNPKIDFQRYKLQVPQRPDPWPRNRDFRISINSFGIGGTNAHVIVEHPFSYVAEFQEIPRSPKETPRLLLMSAATSSALHDSIHHVQDYAQTHPGVLSDLEYTLIHHREHHRLRTFAVQGNDLEFRAAPVLKIPPKGLSITMVFSGQGAQWAQMGLDLLNNPVFNKSIEAMDRILKTLIHPPKWTIKHQLQAAHEVSMINEAEISQPICTALQIALIDMLASVGVKPNGVVGHSSGEIAAAYASGAISKEESIITAYYRGYILKNYGPKGAMAAIGLGATQTHGLLRPGVNIACENSPNSTTISGDRQTILEIVEQITNGNEAIMARTLKVDVPYHSHYLDNLAPTYLNLLNCELKHRNLDQKKLLTSMYSSVKPEESVTVEVLTPEYWVANLLSPVKFESAIKQALRAHNQSLLVEIGPHSTLRGPLREICSHQNIKFQYCSTLNRHSSGMHSLLTALGTLFQHGIDINWDRIIPKRSVLTDISPYPWNHSKRFWYESRLSKSWKSRRFGHHELLGLRVTSTTDIDPVWRVMLSVEAVPWLVDHKVTGDVVYPFACYASMAGEAFRQISGINQGFSIRHMEVTTAMVLNVEEPVEVVTSLRRCKSESAVPSENTFHFSVSSYSMSTWVEHCTGQVGPSDNRKILQQSNHKLLRKVEIKAWYAALARLGLSYGATFRRVQELSTSTTNTVAAGCISHPPDARAGAYTVHPTVIDGSLQIGLAALTKGLVRNFAQSQMPTHIERLEIFQGSPMMQCTASCSEEDSAVLISASGIDGKPCFLLQGLRLKEAPPSTEIGKRGDHHGGARLHWVPDCRFQETSSLVKSPDTSVKDRQTIEELSMLCIIDSISRVRDMTPNKDHLLKYRAWLEWVAEEAFDGKHPVLRDTVHVATLSSEERQARIEVLYKCALESSTMASFAEGIFRVYSNIQDLFTGQVDILELLLRENTLGKIYDAVSFDYSRLVEAYADQKSDLRILEVGAGTGGSTELILRGLQPIGEFSRYGRYTFSDISAGFFPTARERFAKAANMDFMVFDISKDPLEQGFKHDSYDLIIAANVVHATPSLSQTLQHLELLLAPGGRLLLTEFCTLFRAPNYIYGNFSGWWLGDADNRQWEPYVDVCRWDDELKSVGLSGATDVILDADEPSHYCATIISQKPVPASSSGNEISILCADNSSHVNQRLIQELRDENYDPQIVQFGRDLPASGDIIVLHDLESRFFADLSTENLRYFQRLCRLERKPNILWIMPPFQISCVDLDGSQSLGMIRTARSELDLPITTLEIDRNAERFVHHVKEVLRETQKQPAYESLHPDREYAVHNDAIYVGRYRPFSIEHEPSLQEPLVLNSNASYLLTGGLGGLGRTISTWLVEHGARHLIFLSPNAGKKPEDKDLFIELNSMGCEVLVIQGFAQNAIDVSRAKDAASFPIRGVLHLSMQLRDGPVLELTHEDWQSVVAPKVEGAWNLHRQLSELDFFVMTSSLGTVFQQVGQSNYNAANTFLESFCQYRHSLGLPASVLNVCPIEDVGYVAMNSEARQKLRSQGHWFLDERALLKFLELSIRHSSRSEPWLNGNHKSVSWSNSSQIVMGLRSEIPLDDPSNHASWRIDRRMGLYHNIVGEKNSVNAAERDDVGSFVSRAANLPSLLRDSSSSEYLASVAGKKIFSFLMREEEDVDVTISLADVRLDSLMAIELRRWYKQILGVDISVLEILSSGTIAGLGELAAKALQKRFDETG